MGSIDTAGIRNGSTRKARGEDDGHQPERQAEQERPARIPAAAEFRVLLTGEAPRITGAQQGDGHENDRVGNVDDEHGRAGHGKTEVGGEQREKDREVAKGAPSTAHVEHGQRGGDQREQQRQPGRAGA
ncbi:MAG: hypothetical protein A2140_05135 [Candidatus Muproteobacteria bacterium RBG_16_62_13]|uniref:Uncharacterized protein n=1 Tax=Candidatus Muproteobacteria bacterium RBG_16_62_13 TaxID=1817756 RepID=A0A1F6SX18_9PROT|nr:MAG: hypothetical protein A2140_05135 [Candidatus Muproteobacteria bacterium RBG_16_62_13]